MSIQGQQKRELITLYIREYISQFGYPPTVEEIRKDLGFSTKSLVAHHLNELAKRKVLKIDRGIARGITVVPAKRPST